LHVFLLVQGQICDSKVVEVGKPVSCARSSKRDSLDAAIRDAVDPRLPLANLLPLDTMDGITVSFRYAEISHKINQI
jgi:hypothetical protein